MISIDGNKIVGRANYTIKDYYKDALEVGKIEYNFVPKTIHCLNPNLICYEIKSTDNLKVGIMDLVFENNGSNIYLDYIEVEEEKRGLGIGTHILNKLINFSKNFGSNKIYLLVDFDNEGAQQLYTNLGFKLTGNITPSFCYEMELLLG